MLNATAAGLISGGDEALKASADGELPTQQELAAWIVAGACPPEAMREVADRLAVLWGVEPGKVTVTGWAYGGLTTWRDGEEWHAPGGEIVAAAKAALVPNPLAPLLRAWQRGPVEGRPNLRPDRIIPGKLAMVDPSHVRAGRMMRLFSASAHREGQLAMPGFGETDYDGPALPLALYGLGDTNLQHGGGRGAPLALRLFVEAVLAVRLEDRGKNKPIDMGVPLRDLLANLYPGPRKPRPTEYWPRLMRAVEALDAMDARIPWVDPKTGRGGLRRVVSVGDIPRGPGRPGRRGADGGRPAARIGDGAGGVADSRRVGRAVRARLQRPAESGLPMVRPRRDAPSGERRQPLAAGAGPGALP